MKDDTWMVPFLVLALGCGAAGKEVAEVVPFEPSLPGDKPLTSLSAPEIDTFCAEANAFFSQAALREPVCRALALSDLTEAFSPGIPDAELRRSCSDVTEECVNFTPHGSCDDFPAPASCTATVAELAACVSDRAEQFAAQAEDLPDCATITAADVTPPDGVPLPIARVQPASCQSYLQKCSDLPDGMQSFADQ